MQKAVAKLLNQAHTKEAEYLAMILTDFFDQTVSYHIKAGLIQFELVTSNQQQLGTLAQYLRNQVGYFHEGILKPTKAGWDLQSSKHCMVPGLQLRVTLKAELTKAQLSLLLVLSDLALFTGQAYKAAPTVKQLFATV